MVCESRVGWRDTSRRMIILLTDRDFHFAMDGKLAGIHGLKMDRNGVAGYRDLILDTITMKK